MKGRWVAIAWAGCRNLCDLHNLPGVKGGMASRKAEMRPFGDGLCGAWAMASRGPRHASPLAIDFFVFFCGRESPNGRHETRASRGAGVFPSFSVDFVVISIGKCCHRRLGFPSDSQRAAEVFGVCVCVSRCVGARAPVCVSVCECLRASG